jgi:glutaredoxin
MIIIYGNETCPWCVKAKTLAQQYGLEHEWKNTDVKANLEELKSANLEATTIPQIWWNDRHIGGYREFANEIQNTLGGNYGQQLF